MKGIRGERLGEEVRAEIADILQTRVRDPRLGMVAVTRVEVSRDLGHARVYISVLGDESAQEASIRVLAHAGPFVRRELAHRVRMRRTPELEFRADPGIRYSMRVQQILNDLGLSAGEPPDVPDAPDTPDAPSAPDTSDVPDAPDTSAAPDAPEDTDSPGGKREDP